MRDQLLGLVHLAGDVVLDEADKLLGLGLIGVLEVQSTIDASDVETTLLHVVLED